MSVEERCPFPRRRLPLPRRGQEVPEGHLQDTEVGEDNMATHSGREAETGKATVAGDGHPAICGGDA